MTTLPELDGLREDIRRDFGLQIDLSPQAHGEFTVLTPFQFADGDHYVIRLQQSGDGGFVLTDMGHTFMHISYEDIDLSTPTRSQIIEDVINRAGMENAEGELRLSVPSDGVARGMFTFVQAIGQLVDIEYLKRTRAKSTFLEDMKAALEGMVSPGILTADWTDETTDPTGMYPVDHRIEGPSKPLFVFGLPTDSKCMNAIITVAHFERHAYDFATLGIFEDQTEVSRKTVARFTDVCDRGFSTLAGNEDRIEQYVAEFVDEAA